MSSTMYLSTGQPGSAVGSEPSAFDCGGTELEQPFKIVVNRAKSANSSSLEHTSSRRRFQSTPPDCRTAPHPHPGISPSWLPRLPIALPGRSTGASEEGSRGGPDNLPVRHIRLNHGLQRVLVEVAARWALVVAVDVHSDRRARISDGLIRTALIAESSFDLAAVCFVEAGLVVALLSRTPETALSPRHSPNGLAKVARVSRVVLPAQPFRKLNDILP